MSATCNGTIGSLAFKTGFLLFFSFTLFIVFSCKGQTQIHSADPDVQTVTEVSFAERFTLQVNDSCTIVTISNPWQGAEGIRQRYFLVRRERTIPIKADTSRIVYVPVKKIICMSTTHLAMISALNESQSVTAVSGTSFVYDPLLSGRIQDGIINDVGFETGLNSELILKIDPDLVMMYGVGSESAGYTGKIEELGIKVMFNADYLETHPLGKAEWIKVFGALYCKEKMADSIFLSVAESYDEIKTSIGQNIEKQPFVLMGLPYKDTWFISPGNSYISKLIKDAGGKYLWEETVSPYAMPLGIENVFLKSLQADYWINIGTVTSRDEIVSLDPRLGIIPCFKKGNLYNNNKRISATGGNDYWETGALYPHVILKDIASIMHPGLFPEYELYYYRKIE